MPNNHDMSRQALLDSGYREYTAEGIDVYFKREQCRHAGKCVRGDHEVFNLDQKPWIQPDRADVARVKEIIDSCPSGALKYIEK